MNHAQPTSSSAAASNHGAASPSLELLEARQLRDALKLLLRREQAAMAELLVALADFDKRRGWEPLGHASLFAFLVVELGLSKSAAYYRRSAAELLQDFPEVIEPLREGKLCLSTLGELAKVLTEENRAVITPRGDSRRRESRMGEGLRGQSSGFWPGATRSCRSPRTFAGSTSTSTARW